MKKIMVCDSGVGGLAVLKFLAEKFNCFSYYYVSDSINVPYGNKDTRTICGYCRKFIETAKELKVDLIVVACNTMSLVGKDVFLQQNIPTIFVEPDVQKIKNCNPEKTKLFCTTASSKLLNFDFWKNGGDFCIVPLEGLAQEIEEKILNLNEVNLSFLNAHKLPLGGNVFLGCTHYLHLRERFKKFYKNSNIWDGTENLIEQLKNFSFTNENSKEICSFTFLGSGKEKMEKIFFNVKDKK